MPNLIAYFDSEFQSLHFQHFHPTRKCHLIYLGTFWAQSYCSKHLSCGLIALNEWYDCLLDFQRMGSYDLREWMKFSNLVQAYRMWSFCLRIHLSLSSFSCCWYSWYETVGWRWLILQRLIHNSQHYGKILAFIVCENFRLVVVYGSWFTFWSNCSPSHFPPNCNHLVHFTGHIS